MTVADPFKVLYELANTIFCKKICAKNIDFRAKSVLYTNYGKNTMVNYL